MNLVNAVINALPARRPIGLHEQTKGTQSDFGPIKELELKLAAYCGVEQAVCVSSGTAALHLALLAAGVKSNQEVLVPALTFAATANAVRYVGAYPHFVDATLGVSPFKLRQYLANFTEKAPDRKGRLNPKTNRVISALIAVDLLGFPADMAQLEPLADEFGLTLIEDAAQALGSTLGARKCGSFGAASTFSFNNNKIITGYGGGAVLTNDPWIAARVWHLATTARVPHDWKVEHDEVAYNYRMARPVAECILGKIDQIDLLVELKLKLLQKYQDALKDCQEAKLLVPHFAWEGKPNYWLITALLNPTFMDKFEQIMQSFIDNNIKVRALFTPLHKLKMFEDCPRMPNLQCSEYTASRAICLPSGVGLA